MRLRLVDDEPDGEQLELAPQPGCFLDVVVSHVSDGGEFYAQPIAQEAKLKRLNEELTTFYDMLEEDEQRVSAGFLARAGGVCAARWKEDGLWYRARFDERTSSSHIKVRFVDYGNADQVPIGCAKALIRRFSRQQSVALVCRTLRPPTDDAVFKQLLYKRCVLCVETVEADGVLKVHIYTIDDDGSEVNVSNRLICNN